MSGIFERTICIKVLVYFLLFGRPYDKNYFAFEIGSLVFLIKYISQFENHFANIFALIRICACIYFCMYILFINKYATWQILLLVL